MDEHRHSDESPQDELQRYMDAMLVPAAENPPTAQISLFPERQQRSEPLTRLSVVARQAPAPAPAALPFAEPRRALNLKMPLPALRLPAAPPVTETPALAPAPAPAPAPAVARVAKAAPPSAPVSPPPAEPVAEDVIPESFETVEELVDTAPAVTPWLENGRPQWAQQRFECLLFTVGGLSLAVPLVELGTIHRLDQHEPVTHLFGQADWFMGLLRVKQGNVRVVDSARIVMPERYRADMPDNYRFVISLHGVDWGLAIDNVSRSLKLHPDDVRWRGERSKRPWLAGTVVEHMCALLDVSQLARMFHHQDRARR